MNKISEIISRLEDLKEHCVSTQKIDECMDYTEYINAIDMAIKILMTIHQIDILRRIENEID